MTRPSTCAKGCRSGWLGLIVFGLAAALLGRAWAAEGAARKALVLRHFVAFKFKEGVTPAETAEVNSALVSLKNQVPGIISIENGANNSPENLNLGFTDGFLITFRTAAQRDTYLTHPAHLAFLELALPRIERAFVLDYETSVQNVGSDKAASSK